MRVGGCVCVWVGACVRVCVCIHAPRASFAASTLPTVMSIWQGYLYGNIIPRLAPGRISLHLHQRWNIFCKMSAYVNEAPLPFPCHVLLKVVATFLFNSTPRGSHGFILLTETYRALPPSLDKLQGRNQSNQRMNQYIDWPPSPGSCYKFAFPLTSCGSHIRRIASYKTLTANPPF